MKKNLIITFIAMVSSIAVISQEIEYNLDDEFIAEGYDVVSYFMNSPKEGNQNFIYAYNNVKLKFSNQLNLELFKSNPEKYFPQYGGWCAYAMADKGKKVTIDPETYEVRNDRLYLFYNAWGTNTFKSWKKESPTQLIKKANENWIRIKYIN